MKRLTISLCILFALTVKAQVGVNTTNPRGIFNVDGLHNNTNTAVSATVAAESKDDVVVDAGGNVGIGTSNPTVKLEIQTGGTTTTPVTGVKIVDGTQGEGRVLVSDTDGNATWRINSSAFVSYKNSPAQTIISNRTGYTPLIWSDVVSDEYNCYNTSTGYFTAPKTGVFTFIPKAYAGGAGEWKVMIMNLYIVPIDGSTPYYCRLSENNISKVIHQVYGYGAIYLQKGDKVAVVLDCELLGGGSTYTISGATTDAIGQLGSKGWITSLTITF